MFILKTADWIWIFLYPHNDRLVTVRFFINTFQWAYLKMQNLNVAFTQYFFGQQTDFVINFYKFVRKSYTEKFLILRHKQTFCFHTIFKWFFKQG